MKLEPINHKRTKHKPVRSFTELAKEFGKTAAQLRGMLAADDAPKPALQLRRDTYYDPDKFRAWMGRRAGV